MANSPVAVREAVDLGPGSNEHQSYASSPVILDGNPIEDIRETRRTHGAVVRGEDLDRAKLDAMLDGVAREVSAMRATKR